MWSLKRIGAFSFFVVFLPFCVAPVASADPSNPQVSLHVVKGTLIEISAAIERQTHGRVEVPAQLQNVRDITLIVNRVRLSSALEMLSAYNVCAWRRASRDAGRTIFVEFGYCDTPPFPREMAHWFEPW